LAARKMAQGLKLTAADAALFRTTLVAFGRVVQQLAPLFVAGIRHAARASEDSYHNIMLGLYHSLADQSDVSPTATYREICVHSRRCLDVLLRLYYLRHSFESWNDSLPTWLLYHAQLCVRDLAPPKVKVANKCSN
ncbi:hypothetical protein ACHAQA_010117, partial [Verticillium albo-atrum]